uniref:Uncharacterized protein n=1 Tax=Musca domestica TaxID=7370 RepID=A0A1I8NH21_MUSDO
MRTQPSSLPVSERLRFFSSLSESHNRNSGSYTRSPPLGCIERSSSLSSYGGYFMPTTPRSSTSQSSASVTPTPMECGGSSSQQQQQHQQWPVTLAESPTILKRDLAATTSQTDGQCQSYQLQKNATIHDFSDSREVIKADIVKTSPFLQATNRVSATPAHLANADTTPTSTLTPTMKRIKLKTIGKLMLPTTFLNNDRNNNHTKENNGSSSAGSSTTTSLSEQNSVDSNDSSSQQPPKKIGKIKSPFIENCNQMQQNKVQLGSKCMKFDYRNHEGGNSTALSSVENSNDHHHHSNNVVSKYFNNSANGLSNGHHHQQEDSNTDSGKENIDTSSSTGGCMLTDSSSSATTCKTTPIGEIRRKFTRKANSSTNTQSLNTSGPAGTRTQLTPKSASFTGPHSSSPQIDSKYAKYFGMSSSSSKTPTSANGTAPPALPKQPPPQSNQLNNKSADANGPSIEIRFSSPPAATNEAINHHVNLWQSRSAGSSRRLKRSLTSNLAELKQFEEIVVTERELKQAAKEFDNLLCGESVLQQPTMVVELEKIFSSIV